MPSRTKPDDNEDAARVEEELADLAVDLLLLSQELINTKIKLESMCKSGWMEMAKARYVMGPNSVSALQLPSADQEKPVIAAVTVSNSPCARSGGVRYNYFSLETEETTSTSPSSKDGIRNRKIDDTGSQDENPETGSAVEEVSSGETKIAAPKPENPLRWFGFMPSTPLKQSQRCFQVCVETVIEMTNIQAEIRGVQDRIKFINRKKGGDLSQKETPGHGDHLDLDALKI